MATKPHDGIREGTACATLPPRIQRAKRLAVGLRLAGDPRAARGTGKGVQIRRNPGPNGGDPRANWSMPRPLHI